MGARLSNMKSITRLESAFALLFMMHALPCLAAEDFLRQGIAAYQQGKYKEAIGCFGAAKGTESENPLLHYYMGNTLVQLKAPADALREYKLARDLSPGSKVATFCDAAIASLEQAKAATQPKVFQTKIAGEKWRIPLVISYVCSCPMCADIPFLLQQLYGQTRKNVIFLSVAKGATDEKSLSLIKKYDLSLHPTIIFVNENGVIVKRFNEFINTTQLRQDVLQLSQSAQPPTPTTADEKALATYRNSQMEELYAQVGQEERKIREESMRIDVDTNAKLGALITPVRRSPDYIVAKEDYEAQKARILADAEQRKNALLMASAKRKMDSYISLERNLDKEELRLKHLSEQSKRSGAAAPRSK
ncbi:MAG: hypothetical protein DKT66_04205 [Candidatus Melainabacteria bacterium]|nr:MAG: hypothetical protein DKT66_04205 [Candidatus Melainabacteria bacterium]